MYTINSFPKPKVHITMNDIIKNAQEASDAAYNAVKTHHAQLEAIHMAYKAAALNLKIAHQTFEAISEAHDLAVANARKLLDEAKAANAYACSFLK